MRASSLVYLMACVVAIARGGSEEPSEAASSDSGGVVVAGSLYDRRLQPLDLKADRETVNYFLPRLAAKYRPNNDWNVISDPRFYLLTEMESRDVDGYQQSPSAVEERFKRQGMNNGPSLSIVNSLDVLRNRLLLEITRKQQQEGINRNRNLLSSVGKRAHPQPSSPFRRPPGGGGALGYAGDY